MGFFIDPQGNYYEGDRASLSDIAVPQRESALYKWDREQKEYVLDEVIAKEYAEKEARVKDIADVLPTWKQVQEQFDKLGTSLTSATTLAQVKPLVVELININNKMARVLYWLAKDSLI